MLVGLRLGAGPGERAGRHVVCCGEGQRGDCSYPGHAVPVSVDAAFGPGPTRLFPMPLQGSDAASVLKRIQSRQPAGLGLIGMKIAADIFSKAGGSLSVQSTESGTVVCVSLPLVA